MLRSVPGLSLAAMRAGADDPWSILRRGRRLTPEALGAFGIKTGKAPCHAACHGFFTPLDGEALSATLGRAVPGKAGAGHVAIDGEKSRGSSRREEKARHALSAIATALGAVVGEPAVEPETNGIRAAMTLQKGLPPEGAAVTGDAIVLPRRTGRPIRNAGSHFLFTAKASPPALRQDIAAAFGAACPLGRPAAGPARARDPRPGPRSHRDPPHRRLDSGHPPSRLARPGPDRPAEATARAPWPRERLDRLPEHRPAAGSRSPGGC